MASYLALYIAALNRTLVLVQHRNVYVLRAVLAENPFYFQTDVLVRLDSTQTEDLRNQTMYGFLPVFQIEADTVGGSLQAVQRIEVAYAAITDGEYKDLHWTALPGKDYYNCIDEDEQARTPEQKIAHLALYGLNYYLDTAFTRDTVPELSVARQYWPETLLSMPPLVEAMPVGTVVQLIGAKGNLAMGEVVAINPFGHMIVLTGIACWMNVVQDFEIRTVNTTRAARRTDLTQVERGYITHESNGKKIEFEKLDYRTPMRYAVAVQPAPGHLFSLSQLEIEYRAGMYYPRANTNFEQRDGVWVPVACEGLANNFSGNIHNAMQQLMNTVGVFTVVYGEERLEFVPGQRLEIVCTTHGKLETSMEPLVDHNANGF